MLVSSFGGIYIEYPSIVKSANGLYYLDDNDATTCMESWSLVKCRFSPRDLLNIINKYLHFFFMLLANLFISFHRWTKLRLGEILDFYLP